MTDLVQQAKTGVMIALLPMTAEWCKIDLPHMTLVYAGTTEDLKAGAFNELAKDASMISMLTTPFSLRVRGVEVFGTDDKVDVLTLEPSSELLAMRRVVERWNASEHDFSPHVTIGPQGSFVDQPPFAITFDRILVSWGEQNLTFWLKR